MLVKMRRDATATSRGRSRTSSTASASRPARWSARRSRWSGCTGDISKLPVGEIEELAGVEQLIPISRAYKRAAQKGTPERPIYQTVEIGNVVCGATSSASSRARARSRARRRS